MNQNYAKALTFDGDTFSEIKNNLNFVLQRLVSNMVGTGANDGQLTLKLDVSFCKSTIENYDAEIDAPEREICMPQFKHKIMSNIKINDERTGDERNDTMELFFNAETGQYEMRPSPILPSAVCSMMIWPMPVSAMLPLKLCLNTLMTTSTRTASKFSLH